MKKGQIILGAAAFIVTAASSLAFKAQSKFIGQHRLYGATSAGSSNCTKSTCFTQLAGSHETPKCHTMVNKVNTAFTGGLNATLWTTVTTTNNKKCSGATNHWTHTN